MASRIELARKRYIGPAEPVKRGDDGFDGFGEGLEYLGWSLRRKGREKKDKVPDGYDRFKTYFSNKANQEFSKTDLLRGGTKKMINFVEGLDENELREEAGLENARELKKYFRRVYRGVDERKVATAAVSEAIESSPSSWEVEKLPDGKMSLYTDDIGERWGSFAKEGGLVGSRLEAYFGKGEVEGLGRKYHFEQLNKLLTMKKTGDGTRITTEMKVDAIRQSSKDGKITGSQATNLINQARGMKVNELSYDNSLRQEESRKLGLDVLQDSNAFKGTAILKRLEQIGDPAEIEAVTGKYVAHNVYPHLRAAKAGDVAGLDRAARFLRGVPSSAKSTQVAEAKLASLRADIETSILPEKPPKFGAELFDQEKDEYNAYAGDFGIAAYSILAKQYGRAFTDVGRDKKRIMFEDIAKKRPQLFDILFQGQYSSRSVNGLSAFEDAGVRPSEVAQALLSGGDDESIRRLQKKINRKKRGMISTGASLYDQDVVDRVSSYSFGAPQDDKPKEKKDRPFWKKLLFPSE